MSTAEIVLLIVTEVASLIAASRKQTPAPTEAEVRQMIRDYFKERGADSNWLERSQAEADAVYHG